MEKILEKYYADNAKKLRTMVDQILYKLKFVDVDKDDFYSLANLVFVDVMERYDDSQDFNGFLYSCLEKKFKTEMTRRCRYKRTADRMSISLNTPISEDGEENGTLADIIADTKDVESVLFSEDDEKEWRIEVLEYLNSLSPLQRQIALLLADNNTPDEICEELHITIKHFENSMKRILADERIRPLRTLI